MRLVRPGELPRKGSYSRARLRDLLNMNDREFQQALDAGEIPPPELLPGTNLPTWNARTVRDWMAGRYNALVRGVQPGAAPQSALTQAIARRRGAA